jgi:metal-responsive CopG/Arc/MetJ family transcriptional regulator
MKETVSIRLERHIIEEIDRLAREEGTSRTEVIREALRVYFKIKDSSKDKSFVAFEEYRKVTEELSLARFRAGEQQARIEMLEKEVHRLEGELERVNVLNSELRTELNHGKEESAKLLREKMLKEMEIKELNLRLEKLQKEKEELTKALQSKKRWRLF